MMALWAAGGVQAASVGQFTEVAGPVEVLKGGKPPGTPVKVGDGAEIGDVVRTKTSARAQIKFIDDTTLTIAPGSRVAIEEYMVDPAKGKRQAVLQVFQGLVKTAVGKVQQTEKPDFILKSHTAVMGVRGTTWYAQLTPTSTEVYTANSLLEVSNIFPEISGKVLMKSLQYVMVGQGKAPTVPVNITIEDINLLEKRLSMTGAGSEATGPFATPLASVVTGTVNGTPLAGVLADPALLSGTQSSFVENITSGLYVPPRVGSNLVTLTFTEIFEGRYVLTSQSPFTTGLYASEGGFNGLGTRTGVYGGSFMANFSLTATFTTPGGFNSFNTGSFIVNSVTGRVRGVPGGTLTGTMTMNAQTGGGTTFNLSGPVTLLPSGVLTFTPTGTFLLGGGSGTVSGTWAQQPVNGSQVSQAALPLLEGRWRNK
jgi:hypothetical protein